VRAESGAQGLKFGHIADGRVRLLADPCERAVLSAADAASRGGVDPGANLAEGSLKLFGGRRRGRIAAAIVSAFCGPWVARRSGRKLDGSGMVREEIGYAVRGFVDEDAHPIFWGYFPAYD
jgi:hypothetical protein